VDLATTHSILQPNGKLVPFSHAKLLLSIYKSCAHRPNAIEDSSALSATTIARLLNNKTGATILLSDIRETVNTMLNHFDAAAAAHYAAYHPADATIKTR
jgi:transcriptional regulator NrdR family protein